MVRDAFHSDKWLLRCLTQGWRGYVTVGPLLQRVRKARGFSIRELGRRAGVRHALISRLESGKQPDTQVHVVQKLAAALGVTTAVLLGEEPWEDHRSIPH